MGNAKSFWASRTIWVGLVSIIFAILAAFGVVPEGLTEEGVVEVIMGVIGVLVIIFRVKATSSIGGPG